MLLYNKTIDPSGSYVRDDVTMIDSVAINFDTARFALLSKSIRDWRTFGRYLHKLSSARVKTNPFTYRKYEKEQFTALAEDFISAAGTDDIRIALSSLIRFASWTSEFGSPSGNSKKMRDMGGIRFRYGVNFLLANARERNLLLYPGGITGPNLPNFIKHVGVFSIHNDLRVNISQLLFGKFSEASAVSASKCFDRLIGFTHFYSTTELSEKFFEEFWKWYTTIYKEAFASGKNNPTLYSRRKGYLDSIFQSMMAIQTSLDSSFAPPVHESSLVLRILQNRSSISHLSFWWLKDKKSGNPKIASWADPFAWWVQSRPSKAPLNMVASTKPFIAYLNSLEEPPASPAEFSRSYVIRRDDSPGETFLEYLHSKGYAYRQIGYYSLLNMRRFFEDWYDKFRPGNELSDLPIQDRDIDSSWSKSDSKTVKEVLPIRIIKMMKKIITENDFAWPRSLDEDYFDFYDKDTSSFRPVWCPVRSVCLLTLLTIPIRTIQARLLDSGEADDVIYNQEIDEWIANTEALAIPGRQSGVFRKIYDSRMEKWFVGLHITTNKTAAISSANFERGYEIPWNCPELAPHLGNLIRWQKDFNPAKRLVNRRDFSDKALNPNDALQNLPGYTLLFRDPSSKNTHGDEPVTSSRMRYFFLRLLEEVQLRLASEGEDVLLVERNKHNNLTSNYSLHGLRASGITHFVQAGVPLQVIAEFVAGHSAILMTLHYTKVGPSFVTDTLDAAMESLDNIVDEDYLHFLKDQALRSEGVAIFASDDAREYVCGTSPGLWSIGLDGICPTGRSMCETGGPRLSSHNNAYYAPVPLGARNCASCRFFVTGPAFLNGLVISFNNSVFEIGERAKALNKLKQELAILEDNGSSKRKVERHRSNIDALEIEIDHFLQSLQAKSQLIERSRALLVEKKSNIASGNDDAQAPTLLTRMVREEDVSVVLEATADFDLLEFVAQSCQLFPDQALPSAPLRKGRIIDQFLKHNGYEAFFYQLDEDEALAAGNLMTRFLQEKVGRDGLRSLMDGNATLRTLGISHEFDKKLTEFNPAAQCDLLNIAHMKIFGNRDTKVRRVATKPITIKFEE